MREVVAGWGSRYVIQLTLTVDRGGKGPGCSGFADPRAAFDYVRSNRLVARLMRAVAPGARWISVLEPQMKSGEGWLNGHVEVGSPHWHLLIDRRVPIEKVRRLWRDEWGVGNPDVKRLPGGRAVNYVTSYLTKRAELPEWMKALRKLQLVGCSRNVECFSGWCLRQRRRLRGWRRVAGARRACVRTVGEIIATCGSSCVVLAPVTMDDGSQGWRYCGRIDGLGVGCVARIGRRLGAVFREECECEVLVWAVCDYDYEEGYSWRPDVTRPWGPVRSVWVDASFASWLCRRTRKAA